MSEQEDRPLSHEEIWDDSVLINAWNDSLDQRRSKSTGNKSRKRPRTQQIQEEKKAEQSIMETMESLSAEPHAHTPPAPLIDPSTVGDEHLSKMLMAWYYAGYYTGLYQSQQHLKKSSP